MKIDTLINHPDIYEGKEFSKFLSDIKLICLLKPNPSHSIQDIWHSTKSGYYGFYYMSGLRAIDGNMAISLINKFGIKWEMKNLNI